MHKDLEWCCLCNGLILFLTKSLFIGLLIYFVLENTLYYNIIAFAHIFLHSCRFFCFFFVFFVFFGCAGNMQKFLGQESDLCHSSNPCCCSDDAGSLTHCTTRELHILVVLIFLYHYNQDMASVRSI